MFLCRGVDNELERMSAQGQVLQLVDYHKYWHLIRVSAPERSRNSGGCEDINNDISFVR